MREPGLIMKAKQLAPSIESGAVKFESLQTSDS